MAGQSENNEIFNERAGVEVVIGGKKISLKGEGSKDYLLSVADYVNEKIDELIKLDPQLANDRDKLLILASLNITDELFKQNYFSDKTEKLYDFPHIERMIKKIDDIISNIDKKI